MKIVIFDGTLQTTPFIRRLILGLQKKHSVYILGFNNSLPNKIEGVTYVSLGSNQSSINFIKMTFYWVISTANFKFLLPTILKFIKGNKNEIRQQNISLALNFIKPSLIHLQWLSVIKPFEHIIDEKKIPVVISQRGYQSNVRPFINKEYRDYLTYWFPRISNFHSVSKAISLEGDKLFNHVKKIDHVVYTGFNLDEFELQPYNSQKDCLQLLSVGRPHWKKGYTYALKACNLLKEKKIPFHYTIIGAADDEELLFLIHSFNLTKEVTLLGKVKQDEVYNYMRVSSLLILPSLEEGIANVVIEAMAVGLPVISTDCGGMREAIENNIEGWIVPARNPQAIAAAIVNFINLPKEDIQNVRLRAREKVNKQHNVKKMVSNMENLYHDVILNFKQ